MSLAVSTRRELLIHDLSSNVKSDTTSSGYENMREIEELKKTNIQLKKEKETYNRNIETLKDDIICAENAKNVANANYNRVMRRLCEILGAQMSQDEIIDQIANLNTRVNSLRKEYEDLKIKVLSERKILENELKSSQQLASTYKNDILDLNSVASKTVDKAKKIIQETSQIKTNIKNKEAEYTKILSELNRITKNRSNPKSIEDLLRMKARELDPYIAKTVKRLNTKIADPKSLFELQNGIIAKFKSINESKHSLNTDQLKEQVKLTKKILSQKNAEFQRVNDQYISKVNQINDFEQNSNNSTCKYIKEYKTAKQNRIDKMRLALKSSIQISKKEWIVPKRHSDLCQLTIHLAHTLHDDLQLFESRQENNYDLFERLNKKVKYVERQNADVINLL